MAEARRAGVDVKALLRSHHDPYQAIIEAAALSHCESGITGALLGSETVKVLTPLWSIGRIDEGVSRARD